MSDEDDSSKTEEPTAKKLDEAAKRGDVPRSMEVNHFVILFGATLIVASFSDGIMRKLRLALVHFFEKPQDFPADAGKMLDLARELTLIIGLILAPIFGAFVLFAVLSSAAQVRPKLATSKWDDMLEALNPISGFRKIFNPQSLVELGKNIVKLAILSVVMTVVIWGDFRDIGMLITMEPMMQLKEIERLTLVLMKGVLGALAIIAVADWLYQRQKHHTKMMMTKQEVKEEFKQQEGDPLVKGKLRSLRMQKAQQRMMTAVPKADVVVTNPTHYAVALQYDSLNMQAPKVVAKGQDFLAQRIREIAAEAAVPIVANPPLARALYTVELDAEIPEDYYRAVAELISYVMQLKKRVPGATYTPTHTVEPMPRFKPRPQTKPIIEPTTRPPAAP